MTRLASGTEIAWTQEPQGGLGRALRGLVEQAMAAAREAFRRPTTELLTFQERLLREVERQAQRSMGGGLQIPTGAFVAMHPSDYPVWINFRDVVRKELDDALRRRAAEDPLVEFQTCRIVTTQDLGILPRRPRVTVSFAPVTEILGGAEQEIVRNRQETRTRGSVMAETSPMTGTTQSPSDPPWEEETHVGTWPVASLCVDDLDAHCVRLPVRPGDVVTVGRSASRNVFVLPDPRVSGVHLEIRAAGPGEWEVTDLRSSHGTWANGIRVDHPFVVRTGARLQVGETVLVVVGGDRRTP